MEIQYEWVCFDIPFFLQVPDSFEKNESARFYPSICGDTAELRFEREPVKTRGGETFGMAAGDRLGNVSYTKVRVGLGDDVVSEAPDMSEGKYVLTSDLRGRDGYLIERAVAFLNRFLRVYRVAIGYYWVRPVTPREIVLFTLVGVHTGGNTERRHRKIMPGSLKPPSATISIKECKRLNGMLQSEAPVALTGETDLDTQDKIDLGETNLAVLNAERFFEIWLKNAFEEILVKRGWSNNEIEDLLKNDRGEYKRLTNIAGTYIDHHLGFAFQDTEEYEEWKAKTHNLRNAVAHEGHIASKEEALDAYEASVEAILCLADEFRDELTATEWMLPDEEEYWKKNMLL